MHTPTRAGPCVCILEIIGAPTVTTLHTTVSKCMFFMGDSGSCSGAACHRESCTQSLRTIRTAVVVVVVLKFCFRVDLGPLILWLRGFGAAISSTGVAAMWIYMAENQCRKDMAVYCALNAELNLNFS